MHSPHQNHPRNAEDLRDPGQELPRTTRSSFERFELGRLVKVWSDSGAALPVAVVGLFMARGVDPVGSGLPFVLTSAALALVVITKHRANLSRVLKGTEPKVTWLRRSR